MYTYNSRTIIAEARSTIATRIYYYLLLVGNDKITLIIIIIITLIIIKMINYDQVLTLQ